MKLTAIAAGVLLAAGLFARPGDAMPEWVMLHPGQHASLYGAPGIKVPICKTPQDYLAKKCPRVGTMGDVVSVVALNVDALKGRPGEPAVVTMVQIKGPGAESGWVLAAQLVPLLPASSTIVIGKGTARQVTEIFHDYPTVVTKAFAKLDNSTTVTSLSQRGALYQVKVISGKLAGTTGWIQCNDECVAIDGTTITEWMIPGAKG